MANTKFLMLLLVAVLIQSAGAYDPLDPYGNITVKWDVIAWNADGYTAVVTLNNYQMYRHIETPGWRLGWTWAKQEFIWSMLGGQAAEQGDCSSFKGTILPHSCRKNPVIVDLLPGAPYREQVANCCKGGVLSSWSQHPEYATSSFQLTAGQAGTTNKTVSLPKNFTLVTPGPGYTCSQAKIVEPSLFLTPDKRRTTQALMTWSITCTYSQFLASKTPTCCVSLSSFYSETIVACPTCACGCQNVTSGNCVASNTPNLASIISSAEENGSTTPLIQCSSHMCPIRVHWHIKQSYKGYWRAKIAVTNFNYGKNYSNWNLVAQHPNFAYLTQIFSFNYKSLSPYGSINDTALLWGVKYFNDILMQDGPSGNLQSEVLFKKGPAFTFANGWAFPRSMHFNGDMCVMPPPDAYPRLPSEGDRKTIPSPTVATSVLSALVFLLVLVFFLVRIK